MSAAAAAACFALAIACDQYTGYNQWLKWQGQAGGSGNEGVDGGGEFGTFYA